MSRRHFLNVSLGSTAFLFLIAIGAILTSLGGPEDHASQIALAEQQVGLVADLNRNAGELEDADDMSSVLDKRKDLAQAILRFDSNLSALLHGGALSDADGARIEISGVKSGTALESLRTGAELWTQIGLPLADLAAGEFSIFSAAGQQAVQGLRDNNAELAGAMEAAAEALGHNSESSGQLAGGAIVLAIVLGLVLVVLAYIRFRPTAATTETRSQRAMPRPTYAEASADSTRTEPADGQTAAPLPRPGAATAASGGYEGFTSPVDFDNVNASVDQMSVDMNTIAGSTDKMRLAIDSVGHALQGMLYSLNEMAQDTAEGHKVVRSANNAASYTATAAGDLASSSREMSQVVARVTQLALKTKQIAAQIDAEAIHTGQTGEAFTSVVASEVKGLAMQTSRATSEIEDTVAEIMATARQYEEAIGQIIKNIAGINKVSQNLGELMLHPPQTVVPGTPLTPAPAVAAAPAPVPAAAPVAEIPAPAAPAQPETPTPAPAVAQPVAEPVAESTAEPVAEAETPAVDEPAAAPAATDIDPWGGIMDDPVDAEPTVEEVVAETNAVIEETVEQAEQTEEVEQAEDDKPAGSNGNVFMLGGGAKKKKPVVPIVEEPLDDPVEDPVDEVIGEPAAEPADETLADGWGETPTAETLAETEASAPEPEGETAAAEEEEDEEDDNAPNIFMLQKPTKKAAGEEATAPEPAPEPKSEAEEEVLIGGPAADSEEEPKSGGNIFMLNKKK